MSRVVDHGRVQRRGDSLSTLAMASRNVDVISERCAELGELTYSTFNQSATGEAMTRSLVAAAAFLKDSRRALEDAIATAHGIDVTTEAPDESRE